MNIIRFSLDTGTPTVRPLFAEGAFPPGGVERRTLALDVEEGRFEAGCWVCEGAAEATFVTDRHIFCFITRGNLTVDDGHGVQVSLGERRAFVLEAGARISWSQQDTVEIIYTTYREDAATPGGLVVLNAREGRDRSPPYSTELLLSSPSPVQNGRAFAKDRTSAWRAGVWDSEPYHRKSVPFSQYEFIHLIEGTVELRHDDGGLSRFEAGDSFLVPKGLECDWAATTSVLKYYSAFA